METPTKLCLKSFTIASFICSHLMSLFVGMTMSILAEGDGHKSLSYAPGHWRRCLPVPFHTLAQKQLQTIALHVLCSPCQSSAKRATSKMNTTHISITILSFSLSFIFWSKVVYFHYFKSCSSLGIRNKTTDIN